MLDHLILTDGTAIMAKRAESAKAQLKVRCPEPLRAQLEAQAALHGHSLNSEIVFRLYSDLYHSGVGETVFADRDIFATVDVIAGIIRGIERRDGKKLREDFSNTLQEAINIILRLRENLRAHTAGEHPPPDRDDVDLVASALLEQWDALQRLEHQRG